MIGNRPGAGPKARSYASTTHTYDEAADVDLIAIERALNGEPVTLTRAEKLHAARILDGRGSSIREIAARIGSDRATVDRWKAAGWKPTRCNSQKPACSEPRLRRCKKEAA